MPCIQAALAGTAQNYEQRDPRPDGSTGYSLGTGLPLRESGEIVGLDVIGPETIRRILLDHHGRTRLRFRETP